jgi:hypothetical protein
MQMLMMTVTAMGQKIEINNPATGLSYPFADSSCDGNTTDAAR